MPSRSPHPAPARSSRPPAARLGALVCGLFFVSGLGQTVLVPLLPQLAGRDGLSDSAAALVLGLPGVAMLAVSLPAGALADRFGARRVTLAAAALLTLGCALQAIPGLTALIAGRIVYGVSFGGLWTAGAAWLSALGETPSRPDARSWSVGSAVVCASVGTMIGPSLGGLLDEYVFGALRAGGFSPAPVRSSSPADCRG